MLVSALTAGAILTASTGAHAAEATPRTTAPVSVAAEAADDAADDDAAADAQWEALLTSMLSIPEDVLEQGDAATAAHLKQQETRHKPPRGQRFGWPSFGCMGAVAVAIGTVGVKRIVSAIKAIRKVRDARSPTTSSGSAPSSWDSRASRQPAASHDRRHRHAGSEHRLRLRNPAGRRGHHLDARGRPHPGPGRRGRSPPPRPHPAEVPNLLVLAILGIALPAMAGMALALIIRQEESPLRSARGWPVLLVPVIGGATAGLAPHLF
ncbi:hypothetical protein [Streptomyces sp. NPDC007929]|uniref:hypothetical protein n=1 Tax=unclassified Streptomyces TaxID=2593676 RepID=UPI0036EB92A2